jgi:hypothetical protein
MELQTEPVVIPPAEEITQRDAAAALPGSEGTNQHFQPQRILQLQSLAKLQRLPRATQLFLCRVNLQHRPQLTLCILHRKIPRLQLKQRCPQPPFLLPVR